MLMIHTIYTLIGLTIWFVIMTLFSVSRNPHMSMVTPWILLFVRSDCVIEGLLVDPPSLSDHGFIHFSLPFLHHQLVYAVIETRGWKKLDREKFRHALLSSRLCGDLTALEGLGPEELFKLYEETLGAMIDSMLPVQRVRTRFQPNAPWFDAECRQLRRNARRLERRYRRTHEAGDRNEWTCYLREMRRQYKEKERQFWEDRISNNSRNPKKLWRNMSSLLGREGKSSTSLPSFTPEAYLDFLEAKVGKVRSETSGGSPPLFNDVPFRLANLQPCSIGMLERVIRMSPSKSCELDPIPTFLLARNFLATSCPFSSISSVTLPWLQVTSQTHRRELSSHQFSRSMD